MTTTYRTSGKLIAEVNDLVAANAYLADVPGGMAQFIYPEAIGLHVHSVDWTLTALDAWQVTVVADRPLTNVELTELSSWISGQNSDGLGEGFEQQPFAEVEDGDEDEDDPGYFITMASFDWSTNPCTLTEVQ